MAKLYDTIKRWADGQNALNAAEAERALALQRIALEARGRLRRATSLADLALSYYGDEAWWSLIAGEFALSPNDARIARNAAYWQRFMEIRHRIR